MDKAVIDWLLEGDNPAIAYRTKTELLSENEDSSYVKAWSLSVLKNETNDGLGLV